MDQIEALRSQVDAAMPSALRDQDAARRGGVVAQLEQLAAQAAAGEPPDSPWFALARYLLACAALLRGAPFDPADLLPEDRARLAGWADELARPDADPIVALAQTVVAWIGSGEPDAARAGALPALVEAAAGLAVEALRAGDADARAALADTLGPLRDALRGWPAAAHLPPYGALLGCLQALLRGAAGPLDRMRARLDADLAAALVEVERLAAAPEAALQAEARDRQIADLRRQVEEAVGRALALPPDDPRRAALQAQLLDLAGQAAADEPPGSPWHGLADYLRQRAAAIACEDSGEEA